MTVDGSRILVTGATGKTGRRLVALLRQADTDYVAAPRETFFQVPQTS
jgi:uncharacterized protein YbjT (DUF2867 family)